MVDPIESIGSVKVAPLRSRNKKFAKNIIAVRESVLEDPRQSIKRRSKPFASDLGLHPYKIEQFKLLKDDDYTKRRARPFNASKNVTVGCEFLSGDVIVS